VIYYTIMSSTPNVITLQTLYYVQRDVNKFQCRNTVYVMYQMTSLHSKCHNTGTVIYTHNDINNLMMYNADKIVCILIYFDGTCQSMQGK